MTCQSFTTSGLQSHNQALASPHSAFYSYMIPVVLLPSSSFHLKQAAMDYPIVSILLSFSIPLELLSYAFIGFTYIKNAFLF